MSSPFLWLLGGFLAVQIGIAWALRGRAVDPAGFYLGDRRFGAFPTGLSLAATTIGASAILTQGELVYTHGLAGVWMDLSGALGLAALAVWLVPRVRQGARTSLAEIAGALFGPGVRLTGALLIVMAEVGWLALQLRGAEAILVASGEVRPEWALALSVATVLVATALGGQHAVTWGDVVQFCVMGAGLLLVALPAALPVALGAAATPGAGAESGPAGGQAVPGWNFPWGDGWPPSRSLEMLVMVGLPHLVGSDVYAKVLAARDEIAARRGTLFAAGAKLVFGLTISIIALAAARALPGLEPAAAAVPAYLRVALPGGLHLVALLALMATVLSTANTVLLTATTIVLNDLMPAAGPGRVARSAPWRPPQRLTRWLTAGALTTLSVLLATRLSTMMAIFTWSYALFAAGLSLPILAGLLLGGRLPRRAAHAGMLAGAVSAAAAGAAGLRLPVAYGLAACAAGMILFWRRAGGGCAPGGGGPAQPPPESNGSSFGI